MKLNGPSQIFTDPIQRKSPRISGHMTQPKLRPVSQGRGIDYITALTRPAHYPIHLKGISDAAGSPYRLEKQGMGSLRGLMPCLQSSVEALQICRACQIAACCVHAILSSVEWMSLEEEGEKRDGSGRGGGMHKSKKPTLSQWAEQCDTCLT